MPKFRKKPVVIDAVKWDGTPAGAEKVFAEFGKEAFSLNTTPGAGKGLYVHTLEGEMKASAGDYIIKGVKGELYPCKPEIFAATYDIVLG